MAAYNSSFSGSQIDNAVSAIQTLKSEIFPVNSIYITTTNTNPSTFLGGTWVAFGQGRTLIGVGTGTDSNTTQQAFVENTTGGEYTHTLTEAELPEIDTGILSWHGGEHGTHVYNITGKWYGSKVNNMYQTTGQSSGAYSYQNTGIRFGSGNAHSNIQPYITVYFWKRTA